MLKINPAKFRAIKNKSIPNPMRPKFRHKDQSNIYFLSQRKIKGEKKTLLMQRIKMFIVITVIFVSGYFLTN